MSDAEIQARRLAYSKALDQATAASGLPRKDALTELLFHLVAGFVVDGTSKEAAQQLLGAVYDRYKAEGWSVPSPPLSASVPLSPSLPPKEPT